MNIRVKTGRIGIRYGMVIWMIIILSTSGIKGFGQKVVSAGPIEKFYLRAPNVMPGTLPEMRDASYWISKMQNPDQVVLSLPQIQAMNSAFEKRVSNPAGLDTALNKLIALKLEVSPGLFLSHPDLYVKTPEAVAAITREMVNKDVKYLRKGKYGNMLAIELSAKELDEQEAEMNYAQIGKQVNIKPGITIADVQLREIPSTSPEFSGLTDKNKTRWDLWNLDIVPIGSPVQILHVSKSGEYVFVLSENGYGWISTNRVAIGEKTQTEQFIQSAHFIICLADKVPFYTDASCKYASGYFRMGDRLPLAGTNPRIVSVPLRQINGTLTIQQAWLAPKADVHIGYLPYTRKDVAVQSLKLLDNIYDWTGGWMGRNHATELRDIFACFGFKLPGYGELMSAFNSKIKWLYASETKEKHYRDILANDPFTTLQICSTGHSQLYLGNYNSMPIVYDSHGYGYTDANGREVEIRRSNVGTIEFPNYFLKQDIIFIYLK
ncbi:MAG: hypothetical protein JWP44_4306 [Mucilaginibacter sp.]|nr:hypothetical protein [Mucilaginibacter sp.]